MDESRIRSAGWAPALPLGSQSLPALFLLTGLSVFVAVWSALFSSDDFYGPVILPFAGALLLFSGLLLLRKTGLLYTDRKFTEADNALFEYFVQQNTAGSAEEELSSALLENALQLKTVRAIDCMAPRPEIVYIDADATVNELRLAFIESSMSRIIVTEGDLDRVIGYVHVQQMLSRPELIRDIVLPISFVPQTIFGNDLLHKFIKSRSSIACVVDEYGSLTGLVTLEDALEQLFGDIDDEHDQEEYIEAQTGPAEFLFSGRLKVDYLNEKYPALDLPAGEYHTLSGYLIAAAKTIPEQGARLELGGKIFIPELVSDRKIETIRVLVDGGR